MSVFSRIRKTLYINHSSCAPETEQHNIKDGFKEARTPTENILMNMRDRRWSWLGNVLRMDEDRLVRKVLLNCVQPTKALYGDIPDLDVERAIEIAQERESGRKLDLRPLYGDISNKEEEDTVHIYIYIYTVITST